MGSALDSRYDFRGQNGAANLSSLRIKLCKLIELPGHRPWVSNTKKQSKHLHELGHETTDAGTFNEDSVDYPKFIIRAAAAVANSLGFRNCLGKGKEKQ